MMISTRDMIHQLYVLKDDDELDAGERTLVIDLKNLSDKGEVTQLSDEHVEALDALHKKHFRSAA